MFSERRFNYYNAHLFNTNMVYFQWQEDPSRINDLENIFSLNMINEENIKLELKITEPMLELKNNATQQVSFKS